MWSKKLARFYKINLNTIQENQYHIYQNQNQNQKLYQILLNKFGQVVFNEIQNLIIPAKYSKYFISRNQFITQIIFTKLGISTKIITVILLFI